MNKQYLKEIQKRKKGYLRLMFSKIIALPAFIKLRRRQKMKAKSMPRMVFFSGFYVTVKEIFKQTHSFSKGDNYLYMYVRISVSIQVSARIDACVLLMLLATVVEGDLKAPFSIATTLKYMGGHYFFPGLLHFTLDPYLLMLSVKQGGIF